MPDAEHTMLFSTSTAPTASATSMHRNLRLDLGTESQRLDPHGRQLQRRRSARLRMRSTGVSGRGLQHSRHHQLFDSGRRNNDHLRSLRTAAVDNDRQSEQL